MSSTTTILSQHVRVGDELAHYETAFTVQEILEPDTLTLEGALEAARAGRPCRVNRLFIGPNGKRIGFILNVPVIIRER